MKVTSYTSMTNSFLRRYEHKPTGGQMSGILNIEVDESNCINICEGFGVAITGSSCYELNKMPEDQRKFFLDDIYGKRGLDLGVGRICIGSCDYSPEMYSYDDGSQDMELKNFSTDRDDEYIIPMIKEIQNVNPGIFLYASPWSPPGWMKTGGSLCGGYMRIKYIDCYADYIIRFIEEYSRKGINIKAITPQNEPNTAQSGKMPACVWSPELEAEFIFALSKRLKKKEIDVKIWMYDNNFNDWMRVLWMLKEYPGLSDICDAVAFHYYGGGAEMIHNIKKEYPDMSFHFTEGGPRLYDNYDSDWCKWGIMITKSLNNGLRTFTGFNLLLDETGGPNIGPYSCGGLATLDSYTGELTYSGQYRAFGNFSRYIKKGAKIYKSSVKNDVPCISSYPKLGMPVEICAAKNIDNTFVLVIVNPNDDKRQLQYFRGGEWWYFEALPDTVTTVVFEK